VYCAVRRQPRDKVVRLESQAWAKNVTRRRIVTFLLILAFAILARFVAFAAQNTDI